MDMEKIYRQIAYKYGVSINEVQEEMQRAIVYAWQNTSEDEVVVKVCQKQVPCKGDLPTPEELIQYVVMEIIKMQDGV